MNNYGNHEQSIIVSGFLQYGDKFLVIRSTSMLNPVNDTEYYDIPSWEISFGDDPEIKVKNSFSRILGINKIENVYPVGTYSFICDNGVGHVVGIVYRVEILNSMCKDIEECDSMHFLNIKDIDSYIFSSRIKNIIKSIS